VIAMPEAAGGKRFPFHVVLAVRRGDDDGFRAGEFEENAFEGGEPRGVEVLDDFDDGGGVEACEAFVAVDERALEETEAFALRRSWRRWMQPRISPCANRKRRSRRII
jgi:hypothetical protein